MNNVDLFDTPLISRKVRVDVYAHKYRNGVINIQGEKYVGWPMADAIRLWREKQRKLKEERKKIN